MLQVKFKKRRSSMSLSVRDAYVALVFKNGQFISSALESFINSCFQRCNF